MDVNKLIDCFSREFEMEKERKRYVLKLKSKNNYEFYKVKYNSFFSSKLKR